MSVSEKYITILEQRKTELENYLKESIEGIKLQEPVVLTTHYDNQRSQSLKKISYTLLSVGALMAIVGTVSNKLVPVIGGFVMAGAGGILYVRNKRVEQPLLRQDAQDYSRISSKVYSALSSIQKHLFEGWDNCTTAIKTLIKSDINHLNIQEEEKSRAIQSILNTSVIEISMLNVSQALGKIEQTGDHSAFKQYLYTFERDCLNAIHKAFDEQVHIYDSLNSIIR
mgnify:CR=1 FL=1